MKNYPAIALALTVMAATCKPALATSLRGKHSDRGDSTHTRVKKKGKDKDKLFQTGNYTDFMPSSQPTSIPNTFPSETLSASASPSNEPSSSPSWQNSLSPSLDLTTSDALHGPSANGTSYQLTDNLMMMAPEIPSLESSSIPTCVAPSSMWQSKMVYCKDGRLRYAVKDGHRIPDFGHVGYHYGGSLPEGVPIRVTIGPKEGDNTQHIQDAIDHVAQNYQPDENGIRGAVQLLSGIYSTDEIIYLNHDGVILRGTGSGEDPASNTIIRSTRTGADETVIHMGVRESSSENWDGYEVGKNVSVTSRQIPIGERTIPVSDASPFKPGDLVVVRQKKSDRWYQAVDNGGTVNAPGWKERNFNWMDISYTRFVSAVGSNSVTIDAPLFHQLNADHGNLTLYKYNSTKQGKTVQREIGIEHLRIVIEYAGKDVYSSDTQHTQRGVMVRGLIDGWIRNVSIFHFSEEGIILHRSLRITIRDSVAAYPVAPTDGGYKYGFSPSVGAQQILIQDSKAIATRHGFVLNGSTRSSGVVILRGELIENIGSSEAGHRQWSQGVLFDSCKVISGKSSDTAFLLGNRGDWGTSHGWAAANSVLWNTNTFGNGHIVVQKPPTAQNFVIGSSGMINKRAFWPGQWGFQEGSNKSKRLYPASLYEAQRADRLDLTLFL